jgi:PAS domain S-box-containing protein
MLIERSEADILGRPLSDFLDGAAVPTTPAILLNRYAHGTLNLDAEIKSHTGRVVPVSVSCNVVRNRAGNVKGVMLVARDITRRKQAEQALRDSESRLAGIIGPAWDAIITVDQEQRITVFNRAAEHIFRCSAEEAIGRRLDRFIPERFRRVHRDHIDSFGDTAVTNRAMYQPGTDTLYGLRADGEEFPIEATISQVELSGQKSYTIILRDISEKKRAEEALRTSEKLAATGRLATTVAHEINNPLEAITNYIFLAKNHPSLPDSVQQYLDDADRELRRIGLIAQQTLAFYRDSSSPAQVNLTELLDGILGDTTERSRYVPSWGK